MKRASTQRFIKVDELKISEAKIKHANAMQKQIIFT